MQWVMKVKISYILDYFFTSVVDLQKDEVPGKRHEKLREGGSFCLKMHEAL